jgi:sulfide:quinone oxidoreductase
MRRSIVILGAGVGGLRVADHLRKYLSDEDRIVLIDKSDEQTLGLSLLWVMRGWRDPRKVTVHPSVIQERGVEFERNEVESIDLANRRVSLKRGHDLPFDALVVALGASLDPSIVSGLQEALRGPNAGEYYTLDGAVDMRHKLKQFDRGKICVLVSRTPFRCPAAPYEGALLLADLYQERGIRDEVQIDVLTPEGLPMPVAGPVVGQELVTLLAQRGISFRPKMEVQTVDAHGRELTFASGERVAYDFLVAIPPHRAPRPVAETGLGSQGWIPVDRTSLRSAVEGVWAIGDVAAVPLANGLFLPKAAVFADGESDVVAGEVARHLGYEVDAQDYTGKGGCWIEVGQGEAAFGTGNFFAEPSPVVELQPPSGEHHKEKEQQERSWIEEWSSDHARQSEPSRG